MHTIYTATATLFSAAAVFFGVGAAANLVAGQVDAFSMTCSLVPALVSLVIAAAATAQARRTTAQVASPQGVAAHHGG